MPLNYHKAKVISLAEAGLDERWLQERILEDPTLLGLGDVSVVQRERKQAPGGRIVEAERRLGPTPAGNR